MRGFRNGVRNESSVGDSSPFNRYDFLIEAPHRKQREMFCRTAEPTGNALAVAVQLIYDPCTRYISFAF